ncbi:MAG: hypothetical protein ABI665_25050 [Vicinamibacterales bacterium]
MRRRVVLLSIGLVLAVVALAVIMALPPAAQVVPADASDHSVRGAFHIHSDRSDGSGSIDAIAAAAARAGLAFIIVTDHGDGTRVPDPPSYRHGVLVIDAVELSTTGGHVAALGLPATPYPFAGTPADVIEDVHRLGGFAIATHPGSPRASLQWRDWAVDFDGLEWMNADSEWRDELWGALGRTLLTYAFRGPETLASLLDRPDSVIARWDAAGRDRRVVGLAGADAHARLGFRQRTDPDVSAVHVPLPGYDASFRAFSNHVELDHPSSGDAIADAAGVVEAIRDGRLFTVIDGLASPGSFTFTGASGNHAVTIGGRLILDGPAALRAHIAAPPHTTMTLFRDGQRYREFQAADLDADVSGQPGVYRIEATIAGAPGQPPIPWVMSNPIYVGISHAIPVRSVTAVRDYARIQPVALDQPEVEMGPGCTSEISVAKGSGTVAITWRYALAGGAPAGQFAALRIPVTGLDLSEFTLARARVAADRPMRAWMQLRAPVGNVERWGSTFYADSEERLIELPLDAYAPIGEPSSVRAPLDKVESILIVVDTLNTLPGKGGTMRVTLLDLARQGRR